MKVLINANYQTHAIISFRHHDEKMSWSASLVAKLLELRVIFYSWCPGVYCPFVASHVLYYVWATFALSACFAQILTIVCCCSRRHNVFRSVYLTWHWIVQFRQCTILCCNATPKNVYSYYSHCKACEYKFLRMWFVLFYAIEERS